MCRRASARHAPPTSVEARGRDRRASQRHAGEMLVDRRRCSLALVVAEFGQPQRAERQASTPSPTWPPPTDRHQLDAAAAEIADDAVRVGNAGEHAERREPRLLRAVEDAHRDARSAARPRRRSARRRSASRTAAVASTARWSTPSARASATKRCRLAWASATPRG